MSFNVPQTEKKRVVIVGGGFGGLKLANKLRKSNFQVVLIDRNNYHQFPPLIYQIASSGIEPSSISFPFRKIFQNCKDFYFRMAEVRSIFPEHKIIQTSIGKVKYDYLILAAGTTTNFFGNKHVEEVAIPMKNVSEAMGLQNALLENLERALTCASERERMELLNVVIVGGGATGVEVAGALSEMKKYIIPKDYPDLPSSLINVYLVEAGPRLLSAMSPESSAHVEQYLREMGVKFEKNVIVGKSITLNQLKEDGFDAIFICSGAGLPKMMNIKGENLDISYRSIEISKTLFSAISKFSSNAEITFELRLPPISSIILACEMSVRDPHTSESSFKI